MIRNLGSAPIAEEVRLLEALHRFYYGTRNITIVQPGLDVFLYFE